jgi:hypothetical protein
MIVKGIVISIIMLFCGCSNNKNISEGENRVVVENHAEGYDFPEGIYYRYMREDKESFSFDEQEVLKGIIDKGVKIKDAWFKGYNTSCTPPGSELSMDVIVSAELLVRLEREEDEMVKLNFKREEEPGMENCAYRVKHYIFE